MASLRERVSECLKKALKFSNETERVACFVACLNEALKEKGAKLVTRGFGIELFTGASYRTADVDLKVEGPDESDRFASSKWRGPRNSWLGIWHLGNFGRVKKTETRPSPWHMP